MNRGCILAEIQDFGSVFDCGTCGNIHVAVGPVSVTLSPDSYLQLVALINASAANFEVWLHHRSECKRMNEIGGIPRRSEDSAA